MNKPNTKFWVGYYFGLSCIIHPEHGRYSLVGYFEEQVVCKRLLTEFPEDEECEIFPISEVSFILKFANPFLIKSLSKLPLFHKWIHNKALEGYWVFEDKSVKVIFEE